VIAHQHVSIEFAAKSSWQSFKQRKVAFPVIVIAENYLPLVATTDGMIKGTRKMNSGFSCHEGSMSLIRYK
jgi:hypothetical protein